MPRRPEEPETPAPSSRPLNPTEYEIPGRRPQPDTSTSGADAEVVVIPDDKETD